MSVFAIADLHLSFSVPEKSMEVFGAAWRNYQNRIQDNWVRKIRAEDLVLIAGDISWAMRAQQAAIDLAWIDALPGTKVLIRGNHDYWWESLSRLKKILPPSCHLIQNNAFEWQGLSIGGTRLWDSDEVSFEGYFAATSDQINEEQREQNRRIFERELQRLELSLKCLKANYKKIAMTHYPPLGPALKPTRASGLFTTYGVEIVVFGHLHNVAAQAMPYGTQGGVRYFLTSSDYLQFDPLQIL